MAWIESHQELARHPKTKKLARNLGVSIPAAIGHLHMFWWWAMDYAQDGDISKYDAEDIADACGWEGDPNEILSKLIDSEFVDRTDDGLHIHDWDDYAGRLLDKRKANAERKRKSRGRHADVTQDTKGGHRATVPNQTKPNQTKPSSSNARGKEAQENAAASSNESFYSAHKRVFGFDCNPLQADKLAAYIDQDGVDEAVVIRSIERAALNGTAYRFGLILKILNDYTTSGVKTLQEAEALDNEFQKKEALKRDPPGRSDRAIGSEYDGLSL